MPLAIKAKIVYVFIVRHVPHSENTGMTFRRLLSSVSGRKKQKSCIYVEKEKTENENKKKFKDERQTINKLVS